MGAPAPERAEFIRRLYAAWNEAGTSGLIPFVTEDLEWHDPPELPDATVFRGREAALGRLADFEVEGHVLRIEVQVDGMREEGDSVLVFITGRATGGSSGAPAVETELAQILHLSPDGRVDRAQGFFHAETAAAALAAGGGDSAVR